MPDFEHIITESVRSPSGTLARSQTYAASGEQNFSESVPTGQTDFDITAAIDVSAVKSFYLVSSQDVLVQTNDGTTPDNDFTLEAGVPLVWNEDSYEDFELTVDVTMFYITNASGATATIQLRCVQDATP